MVQEEVKNDLVPKLDKTLPRVKASPKGSKDRENLRVNKGRKDPKDLKGNKGSKDTKDSKKLGKSESKKKGVPKAVAKHGYIAKPKAKPCEKKDLICGLWLLRSLKVNMY